MKRLYLFALLAVSLAAASCSNVYQASSPLKEPVDDIVLLEPVSVIRFLTDEEMTVIDDDMSRESSEIISGAILSQPGFYHVTDDAILMGDATVDLVDFYNVIRPMRKKWVPNLTVPQSLLEVIQASGHRYGMAVVAGGFTRSRKNYTREVVRDVAFAILTTILSPVSTVPVTYRNMFDAAVIIFDSKTNSVVYFRQLDPISIDPLDRTRVPNYLPRLVRNYKWVN